MNLTKIEQSLEKEANLISEAISDVVTISKMNQEEIAEELISNQFIVINRQDAPELFSIEQLEKAFNEKNTEGYTFDYWIKNILK
jgi:hypothetical protein